MALNDESMWIGSLEYQPFESPLNVVAIKKNMLTIKIGNFY